MPPPTGFVPHTVWNPKRTWASSWVITDSTAVFRFDQLVFAMSAQTASPVLPVRQWNMLPDRSTSRVTVGMVGMNFTVAIWQAASVTAASSPALVVSPPEPDKVTPPLPPMPPEEAPPPEQTMP